MPITRPDRVLVLGIRTVSQPRALNVLTRTDLIGDIAVGSQSTGQVKDRCLAAVAPLTMVYGEPGKGKPVSFFGAYRRPSSNQTLPPPFLRSIGPCPINDAYFSWAPLSHVSSTLVFYDQDTEFCRGIVFRYQNRGSRAVGQCRLLVDPTECIIQPVRLCFRATSSSTRRNQNIQKVEVKFKQDLPTNRRDIKGWESRPMEGLVKFWFTNESSFLVVEN